MAGAQTGRQEGASRTPSHCASTADEAAWQVDVFVNGNLIPFSMKIGEAGEAFFVFETDEDIPEDIATSPLLEATKPGEANAHEQPTGRFGAKNTESESQADTEDPTSNLQEPEFLDLNAESAEQPAAGAPHTSDGSAQEASSQDHPSEEQHESVDSSSIVARTADIGKAALGIAHEVEKHEKDKLEDKSVKDALKEVHNEHRAYVQDSLRAARDLSPSRYIGGQRGDEVLPDVAEENVTAPEIHYGHSA